MLKEAFTFGEKTGVEGMEEFDDLYNETINCLSMISLKDPKSFKALETVGYDNRMLEYKELYEEIVQLMRKEINVK